MTTELDLGQPQISAEQQKWQDRSVLLADKCKIDISVIKDSGTYQLWPVSKAGQGCFVAKYDASVAENPNEYTIDGGK